MLFMTKMVRRNLMALFGVLTVAITSIVAASEIKDNTPTQITGTLSLEKGVDLFVTSDDFIVSDRKYPVKHIVVWPGRDEKHSRYESLKKLAGTGKRITIRGEFHAITGRAAEGMAVPFSFWLLE